MADIDWISYRHFADRDELLDAVCTAAWRELAVRMAAGSARVRGKHGDPRAAGRRLQAIGTAYLAFARDEPGLFATAFGLPQHHTYDASGGGTGQADSPLGFLRTALDELVDAGVLERKRRDGLEYSIWSAVHGLAVLTGQGPLRDLPDRQPPSPRGPHLRFHRRRPDMRQHTSGPYRRGRLPSERIF